MKFKTHPDMDKKAFADDNGGKNPKLNLNANKRHKANLQKALLKWQYKSSDEEAVPIQVTAWPSTEADGVQFVLQYECEEPEKVESVQMLIPCSGNGSEVENIQAENGQAKVIQSPQGMAVAWVIPAGSMNASGTLEYFARGGNVDAMLPLQVR